MGDIELMLIIQDIAHYCCHVYILYLSSYLKSKKTSSQTKNQLERNSSILINCTQLGHNTPFEDSVFRPPNLNYILLGTNILTFSCFSESQTHSYIILVLSFKRSSIIVEWLSLCLLICVLPLLLFCVCVLCSLSRK